MIVPAQKNVANVNKGRGLKLVEIEPISEKLKKFPTTRFYGSKRKILPWIYDKIKTLQFNNVLDGFGGTGSVSLLFKAMNKDVTYHDAFSFSTHVAQTVLGDKVSISKEAFEEFVTESKPQDGLISETFEGLYFKNDENRWLDGFAMKLFSSSLTERELSLYMYALYQACMKKRPFNIFHRPNLNLRLNKEVERNFGNWTTWERPFAELMMQAYEELLTGLWKGRGSVKILKPTCVSRIQNGYDLVYLDPPYISLVEKNNHDDYWRRYHFLEGISKYHRWGTLIDKKTPLRSMPTPKSFLEWSRKKNFREKLFELIGKHRQSIVVLSYVSGAFPDKDDIANYFESLFFDVSIHSLEHGHALSKRKKRELLFIGRPK